MYHFTKKSAGIDEYSTTILDEENFVRFICGDCIQYIENVDLVLKDIKVMVNANKQQLKGYEHEFSCYLKKNKDEIQVFLHAIEKRYDERMRKINNLQRIWEKSVEKIKNNYAAVNEVENNNTNNFLKK